jgi:7-carboxy-7-deazaguanine synthase (Cx14CxxC type)
VSYTVRSIQMTLQGEGAQALAPAVFLRFVGCNLWSGREADRAEAICQFCDTEFLGTDGPGGGRFADADHLAHAVTAAWGGAPSGASPLVVCTGGEPLLQVDDALIDALHAAGFRIAVESNGTRQAPPGIDWLCISPKAGAPIVQTCGDELKLVYPQAGLDPAAFEAMAFTHRFLQPMDGPRVEDNTRAAVEYCLNHPKWRLSLQLHKLMGLP